MRGFFSYEGPVFSFMSRAADLLVLNLLFLLCCVPVVTIGASMTALAYVSMKMRDGEEGYAWKAFFRGFKTNFRQATVIWLIIAAILAVLGVDALIWRSQAGSLQTAMQLLVFSALIFWVMYLHTVFPLLARFDNTIRVTMRNALLLTVGAAPRSLLMAFLSLGGLFLTFWNQTTLVWGILFWLMFGFALLAWVNALLMLPVFKRLSPPEEEPEEEPEGEPAEGCSGESGDAPGKL